MPDTLTRHELLALATYAVRDATTRITHACDNPGSIDTLVQKQLVTIGQPGAGASRTNTPLITDRGHALLDFMCKLPLPVATTTWELPDD